MARSVPATAPSIVVHLGDIVDIEDREGPRAAYAALRARLARLQKEGKEVPASLKRMEQRLVTECCAESQGR